MTEFENLKIKLVQSFRYAHKNKVYIYIFIRMNTHTYISIYIYTVFLRDKAFSHQHVGSDRRRMLRLLAQTFRCAYKNKVYIYIFIRMNTHTYISIYIYTFFKRLSVLSSACRLGQEANAEVANCLLGPKG
jgi:hypothetical protein